ncbi:MAG TPA: 16S rRNA (cytosine(967)-C(5))-methyltransferase RsmB, partial [Massilibacterium sp.]|nr:16S rRNA (cytosine(967)-C(5))-methyltransferase RsmB [Massilibacterium sp.]
MKEKTMREIALDTLIQIEKNRAYSNLLLNQVIDKSNLNQKDIHLLTEIVYGVVQHNNTLDFYVEPFLQSSKKTAPWVKMLLKMSIYQMVYLDRVPNHAIFYEAVEIAKKRGHKGIGKLVNGVLRNIERKGLPKIEEIQDEATRLSIQYSHPKWLIKRWIEQYGKEKAIDICRYNLLPPTMSIRINQTKKTRDEVIELLQKEQIEATKSKLSKDGLLIKKGNPTKIKAFKDGYYTVQDESSMLIADALDLFEGASILDACAAPGGKTTHIGERLNGTGQVLAVDLHKHKVKLINEQKERLHLTNIEAIEGDAKRLTEVLKQESFDRILV